MKTVFKIAALSVLILPLFQAMPVRAAQTSTAIKMCVKEAKATSSLSIKTATQKVKDLKKADADKDLIKQAKKDLKTVTKAAKTKEKLDRKACKSGADGNMTKKVSAKVNVVTFVDYQCPGCAAVNEKIKQAIEYYNSKDVNFVIRNYPLSTIHPNAYEAAEVAEASAAQGKFFPMHNLLLEKQSDWSALTDPTEKFVEYAQSLNLDINKFKTSLESHEFKSKIDKDVTVGNSLDVTYVPFFLVNGEQIQYTTTPTLEILKTHINKALSK